MADILVLGPSTNPVEEQAAAENVARIQNAIEQAHKAYIADPNPNKAPVKVVLGEGTWVVTADRNNSSKGAIELRSGVELTGSGDRGTVIKLEDDFNARINGIVRTKLETVDNVKISNLVIDGNRENNEGHQAGFICGIKEDGSGRTQTNITIDNVEVRDCTAYGINPHEVTTNMVVTNSLAHHNGLDGFVADAVIGGTYANNVSHSNDRHGFNIQNETKGLDLTNNAAYNNGFGINPETGVVYGGAGITIQRGNIPPAGSTTIPWVTDIQITGGKYYGNNKEGILVKLSDNVTIDGAQVYGNLRQGVRIEGSTDTVLKNSTIYNNSQELNNTYDEVNIRLRNDFEDGNDQTLPKTYYSTNTQILNNTIYSDGAIKARWGIREEPTNDDGGATGTVASGNTISGMGSGSVSIPGQSNPVTGTAGDDTLPGTSGADDMKGFAGNDTYIVNHSGDLVTEAAGEGNDTIHASISRTLGANIENLVLTGTTAINGDGNTLNNVLIGNAASNRLKGDAGNDTPDGGAGADTLDGGDGNDTYYVDSSADIIIEKDHLGAGGIDTVFSTASYILSAEVENLTLLGSTHINATGNTQNNLLTGNAGNNILNGGSGSDVMTGGLGDDTYYVDHTGDVVVEKVGEGVDRVNSYISYTLRDNLEHLTLLEQDPAAPQVGPAVVGTGNELNNEIIGNSLANKLNGGGGDDTMRGGAGDDSLDGGNGADTAVYASLRLGYTLSGNLQSRTVSSGSEGTDSLTSVEVLQFADGRLVYDVSDAAAAVYRLYDSAFDRTPDSLGFNHQITALQSGTSINDLATNFAASAEFQATYGSLSNQGFVEQLYRNVLDREGEAAGVTHWTNLLNSGAQNRGQVLAGFSESAEHIEQLRPAVEAGLWDQDETAVSVARLYYAALDRAPDSAGLVHHKSALVSGLSLNDVADGFVFSSEFQGKYGALSNQQFVEQLYHNVLDRDGDAAGVSSWTRLLESGQMDRGDVVVGFSESFEHQIKTQPFFDNGILFV